MPTYVYECKSCNTIFEADQSIKDDPLDSCSCGATGTVKRVIQPVGIAFKGSGFHINDYNASTSAPAATSSTTKSEPAAAASTESSAPAAPVSAPTPTSE